MQSPEQLNQSHGLDGKLRFVSGPGDLVMVEIATDQATARISTYAGQVLSFQPKGHDHDLLFVSETAYYQPGKAIKGGVPICWPWFGPDPEDQGRPGHGFVRNRQWDVLGTAELNDGRIQARLGVPVSDETRAIWPNEFDLAIEVTVGTSLEIALVTKNLGDQPFTITQALHTYFACGDIGQTEVQGLEGKTYIDKMDGGAEKTQDGAVKIDGEADRIYLGVDGNLTLVDGGNGRNIRISSAGANSAVVWNPWVETAAKMADLGDDDYQHMICVETTNAGPDQVEVAPGTEYRLVATYQVA